MISLKKHTVLCAAVGMLGVFGWAHSANAAFSYGYAEETLSGVTVTAPGLSNQTPGSSSTASAVQNGSGIATNGPTDTNEAYMGAPPPAPQNDYTKYSTAGGGPQAGDFTRGDALLTGTGNLFTTGSSGSMVAEAFLSAAGSETGTGAWQVSGSFTAPSTTSVTVNYSYANDIIAETSGTGTLSQSNFSVSIGIKDQHGHEVRSNPTELSGLQSSPPNGPEIITSGTSSATLSLAGLTAGDTYTINIAGNSNAAVSVTAVPEPMMGMLALGATALAGSRRRRRMR